MPIIALVLALAAIIGGIVYFRDPGTTSPTVATSTTETVTSSTPAPAVIPETATPTPTTPAETTPPADTPVTQAPTPTPIATPEAPAATKKTLTAKTDYRTPSREAVSISVTLELTGDTVTAVNSTYTGGATDSNYQNRFDGAYKTHVIGKKLSEISLSRVGGASLTSAAFNKAVGQMQTGA